MRVNRACGRHWADGIKIDVVVIVIPIGHQRGHMLVGFSQSIVRLTA